MPVTHSSKLNSSLWEVPGCPYELVTQLPGMTLNATGFLKVCKWFGIPGLLLSTRSPTVAAYMARCRHPVLCALCA